MQKHSFIMSLLFVMVLVLAHGLVSAGNVRVPVIRDNWVSSANREETLGNNGGSPRLKLKGYQEFSLVDFDLSSIKGSVIEKATLHVKLAGNERLYRVGVSTLSADWVEGTGRSYDKEPGSSSFRWRENDSVPWLPGESYSDITSVMFAEGGTIWSHADASEPVDGWQSIEIDPRIVKARAVGMSYGFVLFDDTGTELVRDGEDVTIRLFPNRFIYSREQNASSAPWLELQLADVLISASSSEKPTNLSVQSKGLPPGEAVVKWDIPSLEKSGILGFFVSLNGKEVPRHLIPVPSIDDDTQPQTLTMHLRNLGLAPGEEVQLGIQSINMLGISSDPATITFRVSDEALMTLPSSTEAGNRNEKIAKLSREEIAKQLPKLGPFAVSVLDELDKVAEDGQLIPARADAYFAANHVWDASKKQIRLYAAQNEWTGFQVRFDDAQNAAFKGNITATFSGFDNAANATPLQFYRFGYVDSPQGKIADPLIPLDANGLSISGSDTLYCEMLVPAEMSPGEHRGTLQLVLASGEKLSLDLTLTVWDFALPNELGFLPEMNCYGLPSNEIEYYRLAQLHRTYINRVPYSHRGTVSTDCAPVWNETSKTFDWSAWDKRYASLFDGSAFADLPRGAVPVEAFYLPLFENFPANIFKHYNGNDWADEAFSPEYENDFKAGSRGFAEHIVAQKWNKTCFHFFLNNKMDYKRNGWSRASSPWLLDEPASYKDFVALRYFGQLFQQATRDIQHPIRYRCDISRPQWQRDSLDGIMGVNVVGGAFMSYSQMVLDRKERFGEVVYVYGSTCAPEEGALQPVAWSWDIWTRGGDGLVPWQTVGTEESWTTSDPLSLFYPKQSENGPVIASHRLKAYRRGQQDVEYLIQLTKKTNQPRWNVSQAVRAKLNLDSKNKVAYSEDAGTLHFQNCSLEDFWRLRKQIGSYVQGQ